MRATAIVLVLLVAVAAAAPGCIRPAEERDGERGASITTRNATSLTVGLVAVGGPEREAMTAFNVAVARALAPALGGPTVRFHAVAPENATGALATGFVDLLLFTAPGGFPEGPAVAYTAPYHRVNASVLVRGDSPIRGPEDLRDAVVAVVTGTAAERYVHSSFVERGVIPGERVLRFAHLEDAHGELTTHGVDAVVASELAQTPYAAEHEEVRIAFVLPTREPLGAAVAAGNGALRDRLDAAIADAEADGTLARLREEHLPR